jgi:hypothetical protein
LFSSSSRLWTENNIGPTQRVPSRYKQLVKRFEARSPTPTSIYVTQPIKSWLSWFLNCKDVEHDISDWSTQLNSDDNSVIQDIQQGLAWREMKWPHDPVKTHPLHYKTCWITF